ncbi:MULTISPECIES: DUF6231 family protein [unclassified Thioalkalivibrio]|uniref:DUF6231 family protein n=1 Tax=unclassified Thioalkalivibrio TaxID=2621013 RepID=UPI0003730403|nr:MULTISPECIES: DUF6231 family protein [unclassified Thioalkalivibrio]
MIDIDSLRRQLPARLGRDTPLILTCDPDAVPEAHGERRVTTPQALMAEPPAGRESLVLVLDVLAEMELAAGQQLLGGLRDRWAEETLILHRHRDDRWDLNAFLALGFRREPAAEAATPDHAVYRTSLYDYKLTPDWLNARFWANPEMWDRARW